MTTDPPEDVEADPAATDPAATDPADADAVDFAVVAYREEGRWTVEALPPRLGDDLDALLSTLRSVPGDGGAVGLVSVDEDFFVVARVRGGHTRLLLSDVTAAPDSPLAGDVLDALGLSPADGEDEDLVQPAGDLALLDDLGMSAVELATLAGDLDLYPEDVLATVAERLGFAEAFERALDTALA